ncbi:hypothetical protein BO99DRAFT_432082 [Aspergillus violaceofuscus CBS 115571]|uniref:Complex III subunit 9 n=1 Tax=Aspergillus violaceofuscus (strain CBS 115571) TaxID=1450538 RepID=A0A2V5I7A2_ASPV1|nr:hypothetical protein BO99DRAFT_432082 [Aspergillus violaceofuscus CBS 115571]
MAGAFTTTLYRSLFQRNAVYLTAIFTSAFAFELAFDTASNRVWDGFNRGVCSSLQTPSGYEVLTDGLLSDSRPQRQWKDIKHRYINQADDEDDE